MRLVIRGIGLDRPYPAIAGAAAKLAAWSFTIDGKAMVCGPVGIGSAAAWPVVATAQQPVVPVMGIPGPNPLK